MLKKHPIPASREEALSVHGVIQQIVALTTTVDADFDSVTLLALVVCHAFLGSDGGLSSDADASNAPVVTASLLARLTGIPRETVRRKLRALGDRGWVRRDGTGWRISTSPDQKAIRRFRDALDAKAFAQAERLIQALQGILAEMSPSKTAMGRG